MTMRHQYELLKASLLIGFFSLFCLWLSNLIIKTDSLSAFNTIALQTFGLAFLMAISSIVSIILTISYWLIKGYGLGNLWQSLWVTFAIRQYCHVATNSQLTLIDGKYITPSNTVNNRANRSLHTLNVLFTKQTATLTWNLPYNHESKELLVNLFPNIKTELNQLATDYIFNDITNVRRNLYKATAYRI